MAEPGKTAGMGREGDAAGIPLSLWYPFLTPFLTAGGGAQSEGR